MESLKLFKLFNSLTVKKFATRKQTEVNDLSNGNYSLNNNIKFKTPLLRSNFCDYNNAFAVVESRITL